MDLSEEDLMADLEAALSGDDQATPKQREEAETQVAETPQEAEERLYRRDGRRFVAKEAEKEAAKEEPVAKTETKPAEAAKTWRPLWYKDEFGEWDKLTPSFRDALERREKESFAEIEKRGNAARAWEPVNQLIAPRAQELAAAGATPQQYVASLIEADRYLRSNPVEAVSWIVQQYLGTDVQGLADWMAQQGYQPQRVDPVQQELQQLRQQIQQLASQPQRQERETVSRTISEWSKDKPHYRDLERTILGFIQADPSIRERFRAEPAATLDALYDQAMWAHPQLRQRILEDQRKAELAKARAASATSPRSGGADANPSRKPTMTLEEEIGSYLDGGV